VNTPVRVNLDIKPMRKSNKNQDATPVKPPTRGTVAWLIEELKRFPPDSHVVSGDDAGYYYPTDKVEVKAISRGEANKKGINCVCIEPWGKRAG